MIRTRSVMLRRALLTASSITAMCIGISPAAAQDTVMVQDSAQPGFVEETPDVIIRDGFNPAAPAPGGSLDQTGVTIGQATGVNGVGQMLVRGNPATTGLSLCSGTLINPRTVIFAAHCVNTRPASAYGSNGTANGLNPNGTPIAFGFAADNLPGVREWLGLAATSGGVANPALRGVTNENRALYNVEQIWYDQRSLGPNSNGFLEADVAIATLDTPAFGVPTWALLFSPITSETHVTVTGYGVNGTHGSAQGTGCPAPFNSCNPLGSIDYRRRAAENMLDALASLNDRGNYLFGSTGGANPQSLYMVDFDSPGGRDVFSPAQGRFDFNIFGGSALPSEGITAGGDSGGPLIVDQRYNIPVVAGVLSGGSRTYNGQRFSTYGTNSFYQPLFLFWDVIVQNNNYVYAGTRAGDGNWEDASRWVRLMDPAYMVDRNGALVNDLPDTPAVGVSGSTPRFGQICGFNLTTPCADLANDPEAVPVPTGSGTGLTIAGGPGTSGFVPDNVTANPRLGVNARYYEVRLTEAGRTTLSSAVAIDMLSLDGRAALNIASAGNLRVLGEVNQLGGWTNVDGQLRSGGDMLFLTGLLSGSGTISTPFLTAVNSVIAPGGGDRIGTLTVNGNVILASASSLFIDAQRGAADRLTVNGLLSLSQADNGGRPSVVFNKPTGGPAPRHGETYTIASATGGVSGTFGTVYTFQGVLRPELNYTGNEVRALLRAGSLVEVIGQSNPTARAFASALDQLRSGSYNSLWNLYGAVDWMNGPELAQTLTSLAPRAIGESRQMIDGQSRRLSSLVSGRLSLLGTGQAQGISFSGQPTALLGANGVSMATRLGLTDGGTQVVRTGPVSGFVSGGGSLARSSYGEGMNAARRDWHVATGLELPLGPAMFGTAVGVAESRSTPGADFADSRLTQASAYASLPLGGGAYVGAMLSGEVARSETQRLSTDGVSMLSLRGVGKSSRIMGLAELGWREGIGRGLFLTPRAQLGYDRTRLSGFDERGGESALRLDGLTLNRLEGRIGARLDGKARLGGWTLTPAVEADHVRLIDGGQDGLTVRFAAAPDAPIVLPLGMAGSSWSEVRGGLELSRGPLTIGLRGETALGQSPIADQRGAVDLTFRF